MYTRNRSQVSHKFNVTILKKKQGGGTIGQLDALSEDDHGWNMLKTDLLDQNFPRVI